MSEPISEMLGFGGYRMFILNLAIASKEFIAHFIHICGSLRLYFYKVQTHQQYLLLVQCCP
jgi:hypothetical protein